MDGTYFGCFGLRLWTTIIAWIQIVANLIEAALLFPLLIEIILLGPANLKAQYFQNATDGAVSEFVYYLLMIFCQLGLSIIGLIFGIMLLRGVAKENTRHLRLWLVYSILSMLYSIVAVGIQGFQARYSKSNAEVIGLIISAIATVAFNGFAIYIVQDLIHDIKHRRRIDLDDEEPLIPDDETPCDIDIHVH